MKRITKLPPQTGKLLRMELENTSYPYETTNNMIKNLLVKLRLDASKYEREEYGDTPAERWILSQCKYLTHVYNQIEFIEHAIKYETTNIGTMYYLVEQIDRELSEIVGGEFIAKDSVDALSTDFEFYEGLPLDQIHYYFWNILGKYTRVYYYPHCILNLNNDQDI